MQPSIGPLVSALKHQRYQVRSEALQILAGFLKAHEREILLKSAEDPSADVRLAWAELMKDLRWPEAIPSLVKLLKDDRNFSSDYGMIDGPVWSEFYVARAAAHALKEFETLAPTALDELVEAAATANADPFVTCACLSAIAQKDHPRISSLLLSSLTAKGLKGARQYNPMAQAAAWALFDRAMAEKLNTEESELLTAATLHPRPSIAAPALLAIACTSPRNCQTVLAKLEVQDLRFRVELLRVGAAILRENILEGATEFDRSLAALASGSKLQDLGEQGKILESWGQSLKINRDVQGYTSWLVMKAIGLPVKETIENPRKFDLPKRIGIFTTRSLTPARETRGTSRDDEF
jgi:hypothetical protein